MANSSLVTFSGQSIHEVRYTFNKPAGPAPKELPKCRLEAAVTALGSQCRRADDRM